MDLENWLRLGLYTINMCDCYVELFSLRELVVAVFLSLPYAVNLISANFLIFPIPILVKANMFVSPKQVEHLLNSFSTKLLYLSLALVGMVFNIFHLWYQIPSWLNIILFCDIYCGCS